MLKTYWLSACAGSNPVPRIVKMKKNKIKKTKKFKKSEYKQRKPIKKLKIELGKHKKYVLDTSVIIKKIVSKLIYSGLRGRIIIHNAVIAELEHLANLGKEEGFFGLEELAKLQKLKKKFKIKIVFYGKRPTQSQIRYAKLGEIDALVRELAYKHKAILITSDYVQAKSALAYGIKVKFIKIKSKPKPKKRFKFFRFS